MTQLPLAPYKPMTDAERVLYELDRANGEWVARGWKY